ncbi:hypothetical protein K525DRAFT_290407 [Schizophyllum commune Loenen D]|nr:hypothetical protein K525DRAFT_290407 [Schizophyllum commune Loenen D]
MECICKVYGWSLTPNATAKAEILKDNGLHNVEHFAWDIAFSDPYRALSYDTLHSDDLGKWGDHLWELLLDVVSKIEGGSRRLDEYMRNFPRWQSLKHFSNVTSKHFADGQSFFDILKCILPCITQILPSNSVLVRCIRAYLKYRMMIGMTCMTERRLALLKECVQEYEKWCEQVTKTYGKKFDFYKQHFTSHAERDIRQKGTLNHASTRPGEGFIQEAAEAYSQTSKKDVDPQMTRIDENKEAVAQIRMCIEREKLARRREDEEREEPAHSDASKKSKSPVQPWALGSPSSTIVPSHQVEADNKGNPAFRDFDMRLRLFLLQAFPGEHLEPYHVLKTQVFQLAYITYQSREDWRGLQDLVRCNPEFHGAPRYDCVLIDYTAPDLSFGRLSALIRCVLPSGKEVELAILHRFTCSSWRPRTLWDGARLYKEGKETNMVLMDYIVRGAVLAPAFGQPQRDLHYLVDAVDTDMFLRTIDDTI